MMREDNEIRTCGGCGANEGEFHDAGCPHEICPFCGHRVGSACTCIYDHLGLRRRSCPAENRYLSEEVYNNGVTAEQAAEWDARCAARGRLPYVYAPQMCARCGTLWPKFFMVQNTAWEYYAGPLLRDHILCLPCFGELRANIDKHQPTPDWVPSPAEIDQYMEAAAASDNLVMEKLSPRQHDVAVNRAIRYP